jgi:cysteinyl-tRNA synthetase
MKFLGESIDIHGGGSDLIFPHHENEIAQSESYTGRNFVNYWIHNGFVNINSEKMSKSLKNFITVRDVLDKFHPEALRLFFMFTHYRSFIDFSFEGVESAKQSLLRLYQAVNLYGEFKKLTGENRITLKKSGASAKAENIENYTNEFYNSLNDDFNTAKAVSVIFDLVRKTNKIINDSMAQSFINSEDALFLDSAAAFIKESLTGIFGLLNEDPKRFIESNSADIAADGGGEVLISGEEIKKLIDERNEFRKNKDYGSADGIRKLLLEKGVVLEDTGFGTTYKFTGTKRQ